jgi:hypothetical protein
LTVLPAQILTRNPGEDDHRSDEDQKNPTALVKIKSLPGHDGQLPLNAIWIGGTRVTAGQ